MHSAHSRHSTKDTVGQSGLLWPECEMAPVSSCIECWSLAGRTWLEGEAHQGDSDGGCPLPLLLPKELSLCHTLPKGRTTQAWMNLWAHEQHPLLKSSLRALITAKLNTGPQMSSCTASSAKSAKTARLLQSGRKLVD